MRWMVIDGIDCSGKTAICAALEKHYQSQGLRAEVKSDFSTSFVGKGIRKIVEQKRFFSLHPKWNTPIADMMVVLADVFCKYEVDIDPDIDIVVTDRGMLSALAHQVIRLYSTVPEAKESDLADNLLNLVASASRFCRWPDCHFVLKITRELLETRLVTRDGTLPSPNQSDMLMSVQDRMLAIGPHFRAIDVLVDGKSVDELMSLMVSALERRTFGRR